MASNWDERYSVSAAPAEPSALLTRFASILPRSGRALDIACGAGRNSIWMAQRGLNVEGLDSSSEGLRAVQERSEQWRCMVRWTLHRAEEYLFEPEAHDLILCLNFRCPSIYSRISLSLKPGGWLACETYTVDQLRWEQGPRHPDHLLHRGELLTAFQDLGVLYYRETTGNPARASLLARKPNVAASW